MKTVEQMIEELDAVEVSRKWKVTATVHGVLELGCEYGAEDEIIEREHLYKEINEVIDEIGIPDLGFTEIYTYTTDDENCFSVDTCLLADLDMGEYQGCEHDVEKQVEEDALALIQTAFGKYDNIHSIEVSDVVLTDITPKPYNPWKDPYVVDLLDEWL